MQRTMHKGFRVRFAGRARARVAVSIPGRRRAEGSLSMSSDISVPLPLLSSVSKIQEKTYFFKRRRRWWPDLGSGHGARILQRRAFTWQPPEYGIEKGVTHCHPGSNENVQSIPLYSIRWRLKHE